MGKLLIAIPTVDYIHWKFVESLINLGEALHNDGVDYDICFEYGTLLYLERDKLAEKAVEEQYDEVLWLDADMVFESDIYKVLKQTGKDFVSCVYRGRHSDHKICLFSNLQNPTRVAEKDIVDEPFKILGCGFGCVLIKTDILATIRDHYGSPFRPTPLFGEDLAFCARCWDLNIDIWSDGRAKAGHIAQSVLMPDKSMTSI